MDGTVHVLVTVRGRIRLQDVSFSVIAATISVVHVRVSMHILMRMQTETLATLPFTTRS